MLSARAVQQRLAILPFYLAVGVDLRAVRTFRLLRLIRILKLARYSAAIRRLHRAAIIVREELVLFLNVALILIFLSAVGIYYFESSSQPEQFASVFHSLWWAIVTLTTVGYGDVFPITTGGRVFTFFVLFLGLGIVAVPTGLFASALSKAREEEEDTHGPQWADRRGGTLRRPKGSDRVPPPSRETFTRRPPRALSS